MTTITINMEQALRKHWFKVLVILLVAYIYFKKEFSFQFNISEKKDAPIHTVGEKYTSQPTSSSELSLIDGALSLFGHDAEAKQQQTLSEVALAIQVAYVKRFGKVAVQEQQRFGIPASVTLAMAMWQSAAGTSALSTEGNNHLGMLCSSQWSGATQACEGQCYRRYSNAWESFRDHSMWIEGIAKPESKDYKAWVMAIAKASGRNSDYAEKIIALIEGQKLYILDRMK